MKSTTYIFIFSDDDLCLDNDVINLSSYVCNGIKLIPGVLGEHLHLIIISIWI